MKTKLLRAWVRVIRLSRRCICGAGYGMFVAGCVASGWVSAGVMYVIACLVAVWCVVVGGE